MNHSLLLPCFIAAIVLIGRPAAAVAEAPDAEIDAYQQLYEDFQDLQASLQAIGKLGESEREVIAEFQTRVAEYVQQHPDDLRSRAMALTLARWLGDESQVNQLYSRLVESDPENRPLRLGWAEYLVNQNDYVAALDLLDAVEWDVTAYPKAVKLLADCLVAQNEFARAIEAYQSIQDAAVPSGAIKDTVSETLANLQGYEEKWQAELAAREQDAAGEPLPIVELWTSKGRIVLELFENQAPMAVANFVTLVENSFYDQTKFHRVIPGFMAQVGDPRERTDPEKRSDIDGPGYSILSEYPRDDARLHFAGSLSMANKGENTGGSQFFMTVTATPHLNGKHTVFGRVTEGLDVVRKITKDDVIEIARVLQKRDHGYEVQKFTQTPAAPATESDPASGDGASDLNGDDQGEEIPPVEEPATDPN